MNGTFPRRVAVLTPRFVLRDSASLDTVDWTKAGHLTQVEPIKFFLLGTGIETVTRSVQAGLLLGEDGFLEWAVLPCCSHMRREAPKTGLQEEKEEQISRELSSFGLPPFPDAASLLPSKILLYLYRAFLLPLG